MLRKALPILFVYFLIIYLLIWGVLANGGRNFLDYSTRISALIAAVSIFFAIFTSFYRIKIYELFGLSQIKVHHIFTIIGWVFIVLHPLILFIRVKSFIIFTPVFTSSNDIIRTSGILIVCLLLIGNFGLIFMKKWKKWVNIHLINYLALFLITLHAFYKGTEFRDYKNIQMVILFILIDLFVVYSLISRFFLKNINIRNKIRINK